jgi:hypothetical protein
MSAFLLGWFRLIWLFTRGHQALVLENLALRQQLAVYKRHSKRPRLRRSDRMFWIVLAGLWKGWRRALVQVEALLRSTRGRRRLAEEIADVLVFSLLLCHEAGLDPAQVVRGKLRQNAKKYPVRLAKGRALKYTELHWGGRSSSRERRSRRRNQALRGSPSCA